MATMTMIIGNNNEKMKKIMKQKGSTSSVRITLTAIASAAILVAVSLHSPGNATSNENSHSVEETEANKERGVHRRATITIPSFEPTTFHQSGFGGIYNPSHADGARARRSLSQLDIKIPKSAVKHAIPSIARENIENLSGHYNHDEHNSPFSSYLYDRPETELKKEQEEYEAKMNKIRKEWGAWDFLDESKIVRPIANFDSTPYKDLVNSEFPQNSWQTDEKYVRGFISESNKMVDRMIEAIYAEYGHGTKKADGSMMTAEEIEARNDLFKVHITGEQQDSGMSYINEKGMHALSRKLLHTMITNDEFYFVLGGHSAAAGHGNNFAQQKTMQFHHIMEPVFHKLGMRLISRNLAMGGLGTLHYSMGGAELYGEKDFMMWDSAMTEKEERNHDLFNKQALIGGERVPILFIHSTNKLEEETGGHLWHGNVVNAQDFVPQTTGEDQVLTLPYAARYVSCELTVKELCGDRNNPNKYDAHCWVPRSDYTPVQKQLATVSSQASWHPGNRYHQLESRKAAMTILHGLKQALKKWEDGINEKGFPLHESYWHVGEMYTSFQSNINKYMNGTGKDQSVCEKGFAYVGLERVCRTAMHGMGQFTPINLGNANSILAHMKPDPSGQVPKESFDEEYSGFNLLPLSWKVPDGEVDVHAIAIASTYKKAQIDHQWEDQGDDDEEEDPEDSRLLRGDNMKRNLNVHTAHRAATESTRNLSDDEVIPGKGWGIAAAGGSENTGYCDGSSVSFNCHRSKNQSCLLSEHNDARNALSGNGLSGWLVIQIPSMKEGLIIAKMEWWHPRNQWSLTDNWTEVNGGNRSLGKVIPYPDDTFFDIAINGKIVDTWDKEKFDSVNKEISYNEAFYKFFDDENFIESEEGEPVEFGLRIRSESDPKLAGTSITHLYYA